MSLNDYIFKFLRQFTFIEGIVVLDKEGIEVCGGYQQDSDLKENQAAMMFVTALNQSNDNLEKLDHNKVVSLTMKFENKIVYLGNWNCLNICVFAK